MQGQSAKKTVKFIKVNLDKCMACRACEVACSGFHATPKFSSFNPARSRIRVVTDYLNDEYVPIRATDYARAECDGRNTYTINGKEYSACSFCGNVCSSRDLFKEPDSGLPLRCDMCEEDPELKEPWCVQVCTIDALTYEEREEEAEVDVRMEDIETGLGSMIDKYGLQKVLETVARVTNKS